MGVAQNLKLLFILILESIWLWMTPSFFPASPAVVSAYLIPQGWRIYEDIIIQYPPGYTWINQALAALIPDVMLRFRLANVALACLLILVVWKMAKERYGDSAAAASAVFVMVWYPLLSNIPFYFNALLGLLAVVALWQIKRPLIVGVVLCLAAAIKPQAVLYVPIFGLYYLWLRDYRGAAKYTAAYCVTLGLILLASLPYLSEMVYWLFDFNRVYAEHAGLSASAHGLLVLAAFVLPGLHLRHFDRTKVLIMACVAAALTLLFPRFGIIHLSAALPFIALGIAAGWPVKGIGLRPILYGISVVTALVTTFYPVDSRRPENIFEFLYIGRNALPVVVDWVQQSTQAPAGTVIPLIAEYDSAALFYPLSGYVPLSIWTPHYSWFMDERVSVKARALAALENERPPYVLHSASAAIPGEFRTYLTANYRCISAYLGFELLQLTETDSPLTDRSCPG